MDALNFIKEWNRMLKAEGIKLCTTRTPEETVSMIEEWSAAHPRKTRQDVFLKQWPNAKKFEYDGLIDICPCILDKTIKVEDDCHKDCDKCRSEFWLEDVE